MDDVTVLIPYLAGSNEEWLAQALAGFPGCRYMVAENDGDLAGALNEALAQVETEWVLRFDADDVAPTDMLPQLVEAAWDADVVYPSMRLTDEELHPTSEWPAQAFCRYRLQRLNFVPGGGTLIRTELLRQVGGWRDLDTLEDWDLYWRLHLAGARFKPVPQAVFLYRQVDKSRNKQTEPGWKDKYRKLIVGEPEPVKATFYYQATPATTYWRCQVPARHLPGMLLPHAEAGYDGKEFDFGDHQGAAVFQFGGDKFRAFMVTVLKSNGIRTLLEVDDNYLDTFDVQTRTRAGWGVDIGDKPHTIQGHEWIARHVDGVICSTETLADVYRQVNDNVYVCPNSIDPDDWTEHPKPDDGVFRIGWFASFSHDRDEALVRRALSWASRQPNVEVVLMGYTPPWNFRQTIIPWANDLMVYRRNMFQLDVGVAPVLNTGWAKCRSDLKALEYAMAGALPVMSAEPPYQPWYGKPGLVAHTAKDFEQHIKWCVRNQDAVKELAADAKAYVLAERTIGANVHRWREAIEGVEARVAA